MTKNAKKLFLAFFSLFLPAGTLSSVFIFLIYFFLLKFGVKNFGLQALFQSSQHLNEKRKDPDPEADLDPYL